MCPDQTLPDDSVRRRRARLPDSRAPPGERAVVQLERLRDAAPVQAGAEDRRQGAEEPHHRALLVHRQGVRCQRAPARRSQGRAEETDQVPR